MKISTPVLLTGLLACSLTAFSASAQTTAQSCLTYGKTVMKNNPQVLNVLKQAMVENKTVIENRYEQKIGSQFISTEVVARIHSSQEELGTIVCLINKKPLYFLYLEPR